MGEGCGAVLGCGGLLLGFAILVAFFHPFGAIVIVLLGAILVSLQSRRY